MCNCIEQLHSFVIQAALPSDQDLLGGVPAPNVDAVLQTPHIPHVPTVDPVLSDIFKVCHIVFMTTLI